MNTEIIVLIITNIVSPIITGSIAWFQAKKKYNAEVDHSLITNMKESLEFYKRLSDDNRSRLDEAIKRNDALEKDVSDLRKQITDLSLNICLNLSCTHRQFTNIENNRYKSLKDEKENRKPIR